MLTSEAFNLKYGTDYQEYYQDWLPIAIARSAIFSTEYRELAIELYTGFLLCCISGDRAATVNQFSIKPDGYSVGYDRETPRCDRWINGLRELGDSAGIEIPEFKKVYTKGIARTETFSNPF